MDSTRKRFSRFCLNLLFVKKFFVGKKFHPSFCPLVWLTIFWTTQSKSDETVRIQKHRIHKALTLQFLTFLLASPSKKPGFFYIGLLLGILCGWSTLCEFNAFVHSRETFMNKICEWILQVFKEPNLPFLRKMFQLNWLQNADKILWLITTCRIYL